MPPPDDLTSALDAPAAEDNTASLGHTGPELAPAQAPGEIGRLGRYRILGVLGQGGMGVVYRAEDPVLRRTVALKVLPPKAAADPLARERFLREARAQAAVEHDHVVAIYEVVDDAAVPFLAMPVLRGMTLADALRANPRPPLSETVRIAREAAEGLAAAHATGLVHRDIKPGNIWLEEGRLRVKVLDFGLARAVGEADGSSTELQPAAADTHLTKTGSILGTPAYMSPEQATGRPLGHRTDLFSLGVVLYQMATGRAPFPGATAIAVMAAVVRVEPIPAGELAPDLPAALADLIARLLAKNPAARPPTAAMVAAELGAVEKTLTGAPEVAAGPWGELGDDAPTLTEALAPVRRPRRRWVPAALAGIGLLAIAGAVAGVMYVRAATDTAVLEIDDAGAEDVALTVRRDGRPVAERTLDRKLTLPSGRYTVEPSDPDPAVKLSAGAVTLDRGGREALTLRVNKQVALARKLGDEFTPDDPEWLKLFLKQPAKAQVNRFVKELQRLNPDFDGKVDFKEDEGKVVELRVPTDLVTDISPVRALRQLRKLYAEGRQPGSGRLTDLSGLRGLRLTTLGLDRNPASRNADSLVGMPLEDSLLTFSKAEDSRVIQGMRFRSLYLFCGEAIDLAVVNQILTDGANFHSPQGRNLAGLGARPLRNLQLSLDAIAEPAAADVRVEHVNLYGYPEVLAARGQYLRKSPHVKAIYHSPAPVFWAFHSLSPPHLTPTWHVLGPCKPTDADPFDPTRNAGRLGAAILAAPVSRGTSPALSWKTATPDAKGWVDFGTPLNLVEPGEVWFHATMNANDAERAVLFIGGTPSHQLWLNGVPVLGRPFPDRDEGLNAVVVDLVPGMNAVTVRATVQETSPREWTRVRVHLHRLRPGEASPAGIDPPPPPPKP